MGSTPGVISTPQHPVAAAGSRTEPVVSEPIAKSAMPVATATPAPVEEPPVKRAVSQGLRAGGLGRSKCSAPVPVPYSQVASLPSKGAPVLRNMLTMGASVVATRPARSLELAMQGRPATSKLSLMPQGMPASGPVLCVARAPASSK